jgi:hypothetical protein
MDLVVNSKMYLVMDPDDTGTEKCDVLILSKESFDKDLKTCSISTKSIVYEVQIKKKYIVNTKLVLNLVDSSKNKEAVCHS